MTSEGGGERSAERRRRRRAGSRLPSGRLNVAAGILAAVLVIAPQLFGGVFSWTVALIALGAAVAVAVATWATWRGGSLARVEPVALVMLLVLLWTGLQALPLPVETANVLAPASVEAARAVNDALGVAAPASVAISRDPGATLEELVKGAALVAAFVAAWLLAASGRRDAVLAAVAASVLVMAVVALSHKALDLQAVFGIYEPRFAQRTLIAPLMNANHLAAFLTMGVPVLLGLGLNEERPPVRVLWLVGAAVAGATAVLTLSRGGIGALVAGTVLFGVLLGWRDRGEGSRGRTAWIAGALVVAVVLAAYVGFTAIAQELSDHGLQKLALSRQAGAFALQHPWVGVGRGAFAAAFAHADLEHVLFRPTNPENIAVQWASEWGLPVAVLLGAALALGLGRALRSSRTPARIGAIAGVATIAMHDLVDYSLELAGVTVVAAAVLGAALAPDDASPVVASSRLRFASMRVVAPLAAVAVLALSALFAPGLEARSRQTLEDTLTEAVRAGDRSAFRATLSTAVALHPAEPAFALLAASDAVNHRDPRAARWLNRAMALAPGWASPHSEAARWLLSTGRIDQALLEIREAAARNPPSGQPAMCTILAQRPDAGLVFRATPGGKHGTEFLALVATCTEPSSAVAVAVDARLRREAPDLIEPRLREARRLLARGALPDALGELRAAVRARPEDGHAQLALAEALIAANRPTEAIAALRAAEPQVDDLRPLVVLRARAEVAMRDTDAMRRSIEELRGLASSDPDELAAALALQGALEAELGNDHMSLRAYEEAYSVLPGPGTLEGVAAAAERAGETGTAYQSYSKLVELVPTEARYRAALDRVAGGRPRGPE